MASTRPGHVWGTLTLYLRNTSLFVWHLCVAGGGDAGSGGLCAKLSGGVSGKFLSILYVLRGQRLIAGSCVHRGALCVLLFTDL